MNCCSKSCFATLVIASLLTGGAGAQADPTAGSGSFKKAGVVQQYLPDCYILSVGVNNFRNAGKLRGCLNDARSVSEAFRVQTGARFGKVEHEVLLAESATRAKILEAFQNFSKQGKAGDYMVLFLAGHGGINKSDQSWFYTPFNFNPFNNFDTALTDEQILDAGDKLVRQKKKVVIVVDACSSGRMRTSAQPYFDRYKKTQDGGMVLILSCSASQVSASAGEDGAFSKAFAEAMTSLGDLNKDGKITLGEIQAYTFRRTAEILTQAKINNKQDSIVVWSSAFSKDTPLAAVKTIPLVTRKFEAPKLPRGFGKPLWDATVLEERFTVVRCEFNAAENKLVFVLDLKEDINQPLDAGLVFVDADGVKFYTCRLAGDPGTGKLGGRIRLTVTDVLIDVNRENWANAVKLSFVFK